MDADGRVIGEHAACARIPSRAQDIVAAGEKLDARSFLTGHVEGGDVKDHHRRMTDWVPDAPPRCPLRVASAAVTAAQMARSAAARTCVGWSDRSSPLPPGR